MRLEHHVAMHKTSSLAVNCRRIAISLKSHVRRKRVRLMRNSSNTLLLALHMELLDSIGF